MDLSTETEERATVVHVNEDRIDAAVAIEFKEAMRGATAEAPGRIVLDLSQVQFIDSSGLGAIVASMKLLGGDRRMALAGLTPTVAKVFRLTRMDSIFDVFDSVEGALTAGAARG
ncbi:MAG: STAS domain-containing protein [Pseudomonadota bacterium]